MVRIASLPRNSRAVPRACPVNIAALLFLAPAADPPLPPPQPRPGALPRVRRAPARGAPVLLVLGLGARGSWRRTGAAYEKPAELEIDMDVGGNGRRRPRADVPALSVRYDFPAVPLADTDGDGLRDVIATQEDRVAVYRQAPGLAFHRQPDFTRDFAVRTAEDHLERASNVAVLVADLDGDGIADLVIRKQVFQGVTSATSTSHVFFGKKGGGYAQQPAQVLESEGIGLLETQLLDLTGDGRPDLIVPYTSFGVFALIRMLTAKSVRVDFQVFPFDPKLRGFAEKPAAHRALTFHLSLAGDSDLQAVNLAADYTGDGKPDLAFGTAEDELSIFPGLGGGAFAEEAAAIVE